MARTLFVTPKERQKRIETLMKLKSWNWYRLSVEMKMGQTACMRALKVKDGSSVDPRLSTLMRAARALGVSVGFLVDRDTGRGAGGRG